jgi:hypothetical protein
MKDQIGQGGKPRHPKVADWFLLLDHYAIVQSADI